MKLRNLMAAVKKGSPGALDRVTSAGPVGRNKPKGTPVRALHPNSSPVYKTQSETSLTAGIRNLTIKDKNVTRRAFTTKTSGTSKVKTLTDAASLLQSGTVQNVVIVAGAGISTPSGIPDFRSGKDDIDELSPGTGLYDNLQQYQIPYPEAIFDIDYFHMHPRPFFTLAKELYPSGKYRPNYIHYFARLLHDKGQLLRMYTQNIDGLERLAGVPAEKLVEAHGTFATATCTICKQKLEGEQIKEKIFADKLPRCPKQGCVGIVKPDIVFFGEDLPRKFYNYMKDMLQTDMVLVMGTSLEVQPFAGIIDTVRMNIPRILFNREAVGPFRFSRRTQDVVAAGDLVDNMVKFSGMIGWKDDMVELITKEEGEFKILNKSPPKPPAAGNQTRNYSSLAYRFQGTMYSDSSTEESSESDTSSDSSMEENKKVRRGMGNRKKISNVYQRNGASNNRINGYRASSAKLDPKRRLHTEANGENSSKNLVGNMTGRSVKSESGINPDTTKRRLDNKNSGQKSNGLGNFVKNPETRQNVTKAERDRVLRKYGLSPHPKYKTQAAVNNKTNDLATKKNKVAIPETVYLGQKQNSDAQDMKNQEEQIHNIVNETEKEQTIEQSIGSPALEENVVDLAESPLPSHGEYDASLRKEQSIVSGYFIEDVHNNVNDTTDHNSTIGVTIKRREKPKGPSSVLSGASSNLSSDSKVLKTLSDKTAQSFAKYASLSMQRRVVGHNLPTKPPAMPKRNETIRPEIGILNPRPYGFANKFKKTSTGVVPQKQSQAPVLNRSVQYSDIISINSQNSADLPRISYRHKIAPPVNTYDARMFGPRPGVDTSSDEGESSDDSR